MENLKKLNFTKINTKDLKKITGGKQLSERGYAEYSTCDNGESSDTYTVYYLDGNFHYSEYVDLTAQASSSDVECLKK